MVFCLHPAKIVLSFTRTTSLYYCYIIFSSPLSCHFLYNSRLKVFPFFLFSAIILIFCNTFAFCLNSFFMIFSFYRFFVSIFKYFYNKHRVFCFSFSFFFYYRLYFYCCCYDTSFFWFYLFLLNFPTILLILPTPWLYFCLPKFSNKDRGVLYNSSIVFLINFGTTRSIFLVPWLVGCAVLFSATLSILFPVVFVRLDAKQLLKEFKQYYELRIQNRICLKIHLSVFFLLYFFLFFSILLIHF